MKDKEVKVLDTQKKYFKSQEDLEFLNDFISLNSDLKVEIISREEFNDFKWDFLQWNLLKLPEDLKVYELSSIIFKLVWENNKKYSSQNELKEYLQITISYLISQKNKFEESSKDYNRAIKKYIQIFTELYWSENT